MKLKETFILDLIKNDSGKHIFPTDIKKLIQSYLPNPILTIQRAWRRYKHCNLKMDTMTNAYMSILSKWVQEYVKTIELDNSFLVHSDEIGGNQNEIWSDAARGTPTVER